VLNAVTRKLLLLLLLLFAASSLSTVAENVDIYDVSISYGAYNGSNLLALIDAVMNSFCCRRCS